MMSINLRQKIRCRICGEDKDQSQFSRLKHSDFRCNKCKRGDPAAARYNRIRSICKRLESRSNGLPFNLSPGYIRDLYLKQKGLCAVSGLQMLPLGEPRSTGRVSAVSPSLDKIVPILGYVPGNVRWVLFAVNAFKGVMSDEEMLTIARAMVERNK